MDGDSGLCRPRSKVLVSTENTFSSIDIQQDSIQWGVKLPPPPPHHHHHHHQTFQLPPQKILLMIFFFPQCTDTFSLEVKFNLCYYQNSKVHFHLKWVYYISPCILCKIFALRVGPSHTYLKLPPKKKFSR